MPVGESGEGEFFEEAERLDGPGWMEQRVGPLAPSLLYSESDPMFSVA